MGAIQKKMCMLGAFAVGKTSLVARSVKGIFSDKYLTTVGVKIDRKAVEIDGQAITLLLWDIQGEDEVQKIRMSYLRGSSGYFLVADGTRGETLRQARAIHEEASAAVGKVPFLCLVNKSDLKSQWEVQESQLRELEELGWTVLETSALSGERVDEAFDIIARRMLGK